MRSISAASIGWAVRNSRFAAAKIAGERQVGRTAVDTAVEGGDRRNAQCLQPVDHALEGVAILLHAALPGQAIGESADMEAGAEALSRPRQDQDADRRIGVDATKGVAQKAEVGRLEPVMLARPIEPHHGATVGYADD